MDIKKISEQIQKAQKGQFKPDHLNGHWTYAVVHIIDLFVYNTSMNQNPWIYFTPYNLYQDGQVDRQGHCQPSFKKQPDNESLVLIQ